MGPGDPSFLSNVNACYRRRCWAEIRFEDLDYAEDQAFGEALRGSRWRKVYHPGAAVLHAHEYGVTGFMRRYFDEYRGLAQSIGHVEPIAPGNWLREVARQTRADAHWMGDRGWSAPRRAAWTVRAAAHHGGRRVFSALGARAEGLPAPVQRALSLERTVPERRTATVHGAPPEHGRTSCSSSARVRLRYSTSRRARPTAAGSTSRSSCLPSGAAVAATRRFSR